MTSQEGGRAALQGRVRVIESEWALAPALARPVAFSAAKLRKNAARGASRGSECETTQPQRGERNQLTCAPKAGRHPRIPRALILAFFVLGILTGLTASARAASDDILLRALKEEMERSKAHLKMENVAAPYYIEYRVTELDAFEASAVFGALRVQQRGSGRFLRVVVRIGDYQQDSYYGTGEGSVDLVPLDDDLYAIRHRVWLATDRAYKAAGEALSAKQAALKQFKVDEPVDDFAHATPNQAVEPLAHLPAATDFAPWLRTLEEASAEYRSYPTLEYFEASLRFQAENRYFVNSEGTVARFGRATYSVSIAGATQADDGMLLQRSHQDEGTDLTTLPTREQFLKTTAHILETLKQLRDAPIADEEYRGPVLFSNDAGASVVTELIEPNILGKKPKLGENARTTGAWSSSYKTRVLPDFISVFDDPTILSLSGHQLFGHYQLDEEGGSAERVSLVEKGQLVGYLTGREPIRDFPVSNGHGRATATGAAEAFPSNLILESSHPHSDAELKKKLIDLARERNLPYGLYVETMAPRLEPRLVYRVYTSDGHEELVRGAVFGDLDVRSLRSDLLAAGAVPFIENHLESVPFSVSSPALLFDELQVKRTQAGKLGLPDYPPPPLSEAGHPESQK
ncbi:MAG: metallopeptidase TldD-related protein [Terriglobales bacterium]